MQRCNQERLLPCGRQHEEELREAERRTRHAEAASGDAALATRAVKLSEQRARSEAERMHALVARQEAAAREAAAALHERESAAQRDRAQLESAEQRACKVGQEKDFHVRFGCSHAETGAYPVDLGPQSSQSACVQAEEALQRSEAALAAARRALAQAEHLSRAHEAAAQKLRAHLADKVAASLRVVHRSMHSSVPHLDGRRLELRLLKTGSHDLTCEGARGGAATQQGCGCASPRQAGPGCAQRYLLHVAFPASMHNELR